MLILLIHNSSFTVYALILHPNTGATVINQANKWLVLGTIFGALLRLNLRRSFTVWNIRLSLLLNSSLCCIKRWGLKVYKHGYLLFYQACGNISAVNKKEFLPSQHFLDEQLPIPPSRQLRYFKNAEWAANGVENRLISRTVNDALQASVDSQKTMQEAEQFLAEKAASDQDNSPELNALQSAEKPAEMPPALKFKMLNALTDNQIEKGGGVSKDPEQAKNSVKQFPFNPTLNIRDDSRN